MIHAERHTFCRMLGSRRLSEFREAQIRTGKRHLAPASVILLSFRPEKPAMNRPGRRAGIGIAERWCAEGAAADAGRYPDTASSGGLALPGCGGEQ